MRHFREREKAASLRFIAGSVQCYTRSIIPTIENVERGKVGHELSAASKTDKWFGRDICRANPFYLNLILLNSCFNSISRWCLPLTGERKIWYACSFHSTMALWWWNRNNPSERKNCANVWFTQIYFPSGCYTTLFKLEDYCPSIYMAENREMKEKV